MTDETLNLQPDPAAQTTRLDRIEARLAALEDRIAGAGAALPPPRDSEPTASTTKAAPTAVDPALLGQIHEFVRNNPVLTLIGVIVVLALLANLFG